MKDAWLHLRHALELILVLGLSRMANMLPRRVALFLIERLGDIVFSIIRFRRKTVIGNLQRAFKGEKDDKEIRRIARGVYRNFAKTLVEICRLPALVEHVEEFDRLTIVEGFDIVVAALRERRGVILLSGHLGNWEMGGAVVARRLGYLKVIAAPMTNRMVDGFLNRCRRRVSVEPVPLGVAVREAVRVLRNGGAVGFLADQDAGRKGISVKFFGHPASTAPGPAAIALRWGVPIVLSFNIREAGERHRVIFEKITIPDAVRDNNSEVMVQWVMQEYTRRLEEFIRAYPEQWLWLHRRWKTRME